MKRKAKDYGWPHMFYCKADGTYLKCETLEDLPKGFVDTRAECDVPAVGEPMKYTGELPATASEEIVADDQDDDNDNDDDGDGDNEETEPQTLEQMGVSRKEAIAVLKEAGVEFKKNASNVDIAALVEALLEEETEEETEE